MKHPKYFAAILILIIVWLSLAITIANAQSGIIAYNVWNQPMASAIYANKDIKQCSFAFYWSKIETKKDVFDFSILDKELNQCIKSGKQFNIRIAASGRSPQYVIDSSQSMKITQFRGDGSKKMFTVTIPVPYDPYYQNRWLNFIDRLSQHINSNPKYAASLLSVSITGISLTNEEMRMPNQLDEGATSGATNYITILTDANYSGQKIINCFAKFQRAFIRAFPDKKLVIALGNGWFPHWPDSIDVNQEIINKCLTTNKPDRYIFIQTSLTPTSTGGFISKIKAQGFKVGYQTNASIFDNPPCLINKNIKCSDQEFSQALARGLNLVSFIEVQQKAIIAYPLAVSKAQIKFTSKLGQE